MAPTLGPAGAARLHADDAGFAWTSPRTAQVPAGYDIDEHPNRRDVDPALLDPARPTEPGGGPLVAAELQDSFRQRGWAMDQHGRPVHPHAAQLLADPRIGQPTSLGFAYYLGESVVADAVAVAGDRVVLTTRATRHEGLIPSLPGGYSTPADEGRTPAQWRAGDRPVTVEGSSPRPAGNSTTKPACSPRTTAEPRSCARSGPSPPCTPSTPGPSSTPCDSICPPART